MGKKMKFKVADIVVMVAVIAVTIISLMTIANNLM